MNTVTKRNSPFTGWYVDNGIAFIPYSASFKLNDITYMATTDAEAERLGKMIAKDCDMAEATFLKNHPELNP